MMQETRMNKKTLILVVLFLTPILFVPQAYASGTTEVNSFAGGASSLTVISDGNNSSMSLQLDLERNVTFQEASFVVEGQSVADTPGSVWINSTSGNTLWAYSGIGYGDLSHQNTFQTGLDYDTIQLNNSSGMPSPILLPKNASLQSSQANITYSPNLDAQYVQVGAVRHMELGDSNGDNLTDAFVFSTSNSTTGVNTAFAVVESNQTSMQYNLTNWTSTCINSDQMRIADMNNDSHDDVITFSAGSSMMCIHEYNTTTMTYDPSFSVNITASPIDVQLADMDGDGYPDFISIHGYFGGGSVSLTTYNGSTGATRLADDIDVYRWNFWDGRTSLRSLRVDDFFNRNQTMIIVSDAWNDGTEITYDTQTGQLNNNIEKFRNLTLDSVMGDLDDDGDIDFLTPKQTESVIVLNNGTGWEQVPMFHVLETMNGTFADHDNDGTISLLTPNPQFGDGNPSTLEGDIGHRTVSSTGLGSPSLTPLTPYSVPRDIQFSDVDNDGLMDQFVLAGETLQGVFIGGWHNLSLDSDVNGNVDLWAEGYSSATIPHIGVLTITDTDDTIKNSVAPFLPAYPGISDGYGIEMVSNMMSLSSNSNGTVNFTDLDIAYDIEFSVKNSAGTIGSLSNSLNQQMLPGTGTFTVALPVETTKSGQFDVTTLSMNYTLGAPNLALPPTPVLTVQTLSENGVTIEWQALSEFGSDLQEFQVFRMTSSSPYDYSSPLGVVTGQNSYADSDVVIGSTYAYKVRSMHSYGVVSNLSQSLEVTIPYPTPPAAVTNVQIYDLDVETATAPMKVTWDASLDSNVDEYRVFIKEAGSWDTEISDFFGNGTVTSDKKYQIVPYDDINNWYRTYSPVATVGSDVTEVDVTETSEYYDMNAGNSVATTIQDASQYYAVVLALDTYGNASLPHLAGPTTIYNNSYINSQLSLSVESGPDSIPVLESTSPLTVSVYAYYLNETQSETAIENAQIEVKLTYADEEFVLNGQTDANGLWTAVDVEDLHNILIPQTLLDYSALDTGVVDIVATMASIEPSATQPFSGAMATTSMGTGVTVELSGPQSAVDMDANDAIDINITLSATDTVNPAHQASLEGVTILWEAYDSTSGNVSMTGSETISTGKIRIVSSFENMSRIEFMVDSTGRTLFGTTTFTVLLNEYVVPNQDNETDQTVTEWVPTSIDSVTIACESSTILTNKQASDDPIDCLLNNPNPFTVDVRVSVTSSPSLFKAPGTLSIVANGSETISFVPKYQDALWDRQDDVNSDKEFTIQIITSSSEYDITDQPLLNDVVTWTASLHVEEPTTTDGEDKSSSNGALYGGIGAVVAILAIVGYIVFNRRASADFDDASFYEEEEFIEENEVEPVEIPEGKPLDEFDDKTISEEPEVIERPGDSLISELSESTEESVEDVTEEVVEEEEQDDDDGISTDEFGTEWYEDEVGTWWYREAGAEDWSEYSE